MRIKNMLISGLFFILLLGVIISSRAAAEEQSTTVIARGPDWEDTSTGEKHITKVYPLAVNFYNGHEYEPVDTTITSSLDPLFDYEVTKGFYKAYFKSDPTLGQVVKYVKDDVEITFQPMALNYRNDLDQIQQIQMINGVSGVPSNNNFIYENAYGAGIDLAYRYTHYSLKEELHIQDFSVLATPEQYIVEGGNPTLDLDFVLTTNANHIFIEGVEWDKKTTMITGNAVQIKDEGGNVLYTLPKPVAYDNEYDKVELTYEFKKQGNALYVVVKTPYDFIQNAVYPVTIDPSVAITAGRTGNVSILCGKKAGQGDANPYPLTTTNNATAVGYSNVAADDTNHMTANSGGQCPAGSSGFGLVQINWTVAGVSASEVDEFNVSIFVANYPNLASGYIRNQNSGAWEDMCILTQYGGGGPSGNEYWCSWNGSTASNYFADETDWGTSIVLGVNGSADTDIMTMYWDYAYLTVLWTESPSGASEAEGDAAISAAINSSIPSATSYSEQQAYIVNSTSIHSEGTFDWVASFGSKRWLLSYVTAGETPTGAVNVSEAVYVREITTNMTESQIIADISNFINATK